MCCTKLAWKPIIYVCTPSMSSAVLFMSSIRISTIEQLSICGQTVHRDFLSGSITCRGIRWDGLLGPPSILECNSLVFGLKCSFYQTGRSTIFVVLFRLGLEFWLRWPRLHFATLQFHRFAMIQIARACWLIYRGCHIWQIKYWYQWNELSKSSWSN